MPVPFAGEEERKRLWRCLSRAQFGGFKFRRQTTIDHRIVDFLCPAKGLIVEVDGSTHDRERDDALDRRMAAQYGYRTIRVTNEEMFGNMDGVQQHIQHVAYQTPDRWSSPEGEGL